MPDSRPPVTDPLVASLAKPMPSRDFKPRVEPKFDPTPKNESKVEPPVNTKSEPKFEPSATPAKAPLDNLEEEMASLLGRPPGKT
jgi:hypothetical protein